MTVTVPPLLAPAIPGAGPLESFGSVASAAVACRAAPLSPSSSVRLLFVHALRSKVSATSAANGCLFMRTSFQSYAGIDGRVEHVDDDVGGDDERRGQQHGAHDGRQVAFANGVDRGTAEAA